ncbi:hypothetical protein KAU32_00565 [bacterium]|nr:hypothetical protein [bacterium]
MFLQIIRPYSTPNISGVKQWFIFFFYLFYFSLSFLPKTGRNGRYKEPGALIYKYDNNGILGFELISTNDEYGVPLVVRKRRMRKKLTKYDIPSGLKLFFCLLRCSSLTYRCGYAAFLAP